MANPNLTPTEILPSKPVKTELFEKIKNINDDVESRLTGQENVSTSQPVFDQTVSIGNPTITTPDLIIAITPAFKNAITLVSSKITLLEKDIAYLEDATVNGVEIKVDKSSGGVADVDFTSEIFTVRPYIDFQTGASPAANSNDAGTFDLGEINIAAGDRLRLVLTGMPASPQLVKFIFELFI